MSLHQRQAARARRKLRVRNRVNGTTARPRLSVFRSLQHISAQLIDDTEGRTLAAASTAEAECRKAGFGATMAGAKKVGELIATRAKAKSIAQVVFDRGGYLYHGRVKALADA
ncbi:MAG: 50S ribosomal protein L18, partial [Deltaproteobacteria bacterium]|nr:50S ribosomal protein L18 [Deltaproteobacteria bacterium]